MRWRAKWMRRGGREAVLVGQHGADAEGRAAEWTAPRFRGWAKAQGIEVKDRGRVPAELVVEFKAATRQ